MSSESEVLRRIDSEGEHAIAELFELHRKRLLAMVSFRLGTKLRGRVDPEDVLQEAYLDAVQRIDHFTNNPVTSIFVWFRVVTAQTLSTVHRRHLGTKKRDANREVPNRREVDGDETAASIIACTVGHLTSPSQAAIRDERRKQLKEALSDLPELDQEVLALRHFEELSNVEVSEELNITTKTASVRYMRALRRLKSVLQPLPDDMPSTG